MDPNLKSYGLILGMALVVYTVRIAGFWLAGHLKMSRRVHAWLHYLPGCILISIVAPMLKGAGIAALLATVAVVLVMWKTDSFLLAMATGVLLVSSVNLL